MARLGNYELGALIGSGGVGQVHAARDPAGRNVAIKRLRDTLSPDPRMRELLGDEGRVSQRVSHPNVVRVFAHDFDADGSPFIVMDHAPGTTLRVLVGHGPLPVARVRLLALQLFDGLAAIHDSGVVHADLTHSNLIIDDADHLTIIDFGLAHTQMSQVDLDEGLAVFGTPEFMAPELFAGARPTVGSDIYAVGILLYEMLYGTLPFCGVSPAQILARMTDGATFPAGVDGLEHVLRRALDRDVAKRFQTVRQLATAFADATPLPLPEDPLIQRWRDQLLDALANPPAHPIIVAYSGLADALIGAGRMRDAIGELEDALEMLTPATGLPPPALWRITLLLAAMCGRVGWPARSRQLLLSAHDQATRAGDRDGIERARWLTRRLAGTRGTIRPPANRPRAELRGPGNAYLVGVGERR